MNRLRHGIVGAVILIALPVLFSCREQASIENQSPSPHSLDTAFWVWNRSQALTESERLELKEAKVKQLFWQIGEIEISNGDIVTKARWEIQDSVPDLDLVPVIRLEPTIRNPSEIDPQALAKWAKDAGVTKSIQFDYDCPVRLLSAYAKLLQEFREAFGPVELSTTALGNWCHSEHWPELQTAVDSVYPMLYDVLPERKQETFQPEQVMPLVDSEYLNRLILKWDAVTSIPWRVGLPNFTRLSIFRDGRPKGHIRSWSLEELVENGDLDFKGESPGVSYFQVNTSNRVGGIPLQMDDWLCIRSCDRAELRTVIESLRSTSAQGIIWFQMPRQGLASSGWSTAEIANQFKGTPVLNVFIRDNRLILTNSGGGDLPPAFESGGHEIKLSWTRPFLREFIPGEFSVAGILQNDRSVPLVAATELRLRFSSLAAGKSLASGLILFHQEINSLALNYQIGNNSLKPLLKKP